MSILLVLVPSFPFLSFPFLSFPLLSFPLLSFHFDVDCDYDLFYVCVYYFNRIVLILLGVLYAIGLVLVLGLGLVAAWRNARAHITFPFAFTLALDNEYLSLRLKYPSYSPALTKKSIVPVCISIPGDQYISISGDQYIR